MHLKRPMTNKVSNNNRKTNKNQLNWANKLPKHSIEPKEKRFIASRTKMWVNNEN